MATEVHVDVAGAPRKFSDGAQHVTVRDELGGALEPATQGLFVEIANLTDSRASVTEGTNKITIPTGLTVLDVEFYDDGSAAADKLYLAFNAVDDADGSYMLGTAGERAVVTLGRVKRYRFAASAPCVRIDLKSDAATETGATLVIIEGALT